MRTGGGERHPVVGLGQVVLHSVFGGEELKLGLNEVAQPGVIGSLAFALVDQHLDLIA